MQDKRSVLQGELDEVQTQITELRKVLPAATSREVDRALLLRLRRRVKSLEQALSRLGQGCYGICMRCGKSIHTERLVALPDAKTRIDCAQRVWVKRQRPTVYD